MNYYCFTKDEILQLIKDLKIHSYADEELLVKMAILSSSAVIDEDDIDSVNTQATCPKCTQKVECYTKHRTFKGDLSYSEDWSCSDELPICPNCKCLVYETYGHHKEYYDHKESEWECCYDSE